MASDAFFRQRANAMITRRGARASLRRDGADRPCVAVITEYKPYEKQFRLEGSRRALISALDPTTGQPLQIPPDHEQDLLVFNGDIYRLPLPDTGPRPSGIVLYHELEVLFDSRASQ